MSRFAYDFELSGEPKLMGGFGSGRPQILPSLWTLYSVRTKQIREACDFRPGLVGSITFGDGTSISVRTSPGYVHVNDVPLMLDWTAPHLGGRRAWFLCCSCGRRCTVVYGRDLQWGCRRCWRANYPSQKQDRYERLIRRAGRLRRRLGDTVAKAPVDHVDLAGIPPDKPVRMHWRTYGRLAKELEQVEVEIGQQFVQSAERFLARCRQRGATP